MNDLTPGERIRGDEVDIVLEKCLGKNGTDYFFKITLHGQDKRIGYLRITVTTDEYIEKFWGHLGYGIDKDFRGNNYAAKACLLLKDLLLKHDFGRVFITCHPNNIASIKTIEALGAKFVETVDIPEDDADLVGSNQGCLKKNRYLWTIN